MKTTDDSVRDLWTAVEGRVSKWVFIIVIGIASTVLSGLFFYQMSIAGKIDQINVNIAKLTTTTASILEEHKTRH
jgi:uncharacterized membrane protein